MLQLADAGAPVLTTDYRSCYSACRDAGGEIAGCMEQCADLMPGDTTAPGGCGDSTVWTAFADCLVSGFEIPESVQRLPGTIADVAGQLTAPLNRTLLLVIGAALALVWLRRG